MYNQGEVCSAGSRVYVHEDIYDIFIAKLTERAEKVKLGSGLSHNTTMGSLV